MVRDHHVPKTKIKITNCYHGDLLNVCKMCETQSLLKKKVSENANNNDATLLHYMNIFRTESSWSASEAVKTQKPKQSETVKTQKPKQSTHTESRIVLHMYLVQVHRQDGQETC